MVRIPHTSLFGEGFYQDSQVIRIQKSSLPGLTASPQNTAESLLVGLILRAYSVFLFYLTDENGEVLTDENDEPLQDDQSTVYEFLNISFWRTFPQSKFGVPTITHTFLIELYASPLIPYNQPILPSDLE